VRRFAYLWAACLPDTLHRARPAIITGLLALSGCDMPPADEPPTAYPGYTGNYPGFSLVLDERFDSFDTAVWETGDGAVGTESMCRFQGRAVRIRDGMLELLIDEQQVPTGWSENHQKMKRAYDYVCGEVRTRPELRMRYGRIETRLRAPDRDRASGYISSLFTYVNEGNDDFDREWEEIDIELEGGRPDAFQANLIYGRDTVSWGETRKFGAWEDKINIGPADSWRVYAIEWLPDRISWYVDGERVKTLAAQDLNCDPACIAPQEQPTPIPDQPADVMLNFWIPNDAIEAVFGGQKSSNQYPMHARYDWLRIYQYDAEPMQNWRSEQLSLLATPAPARATPTLETTIEDVQRALTAGTASCVDIIDGYLRRIAAFDQSTGLNSVIFSNPAALAKARAIDEKLKNKEALGPLFCVPVLLKDNFDTADMPTSGGSIALKNSIPPDDAFMVRKLREADAIIIAKTNMAEWAFSPRQTTSSSYGTTANAYALDRVPAGSSGGTASATAANFGIVGMGTDTGNSIRGPSSHLALFGIRSTIGLTSRDGVIPLAFDRDIAGPMTRTVTDAARVFNVIAGYDPADPFTALGRGRREADYTTFLDAKGMAGKRIGVLRALVDTEDADPEVTAVFEQALLDLQSLGAELVDPITIANFAAHLDGDYFCARFRYDMHQYLQSLGPDAPLRDVMSVRETGQYSPYIEGGLDYFAANPADVPPRDLDPPCLPFPEHPGRQAFLEDVVAAMDAERLDALVYPSWTNPPAHLDNPDEEYLGDNSQLVAPATGMPAVSVPMGYSYATLPAGLQILGRPYSEGLLFTLAYAYEQATLHRRPPARFPALPDQAP
jgi:amidase